MLVPIFICTFLGIFIDKKLGTSFVFIILFFIGAMAGGRNIYVLAKRIYSKPSESRDISGAHISDGYTKDPDTESGSSRVPDGYTEDAGEDTAGRDGISDED